ncbi:MAG: S8 family serine peptidase [Fimbriimonas sp.]
MAAFLAAIGQAKIFVEDPGVLEFSGEMIVRPLQVEALAAKGITGRSAQLVISRARQRLLSLTRRYEAATDEYIIKVPYVTTENRLAADLMKTGDYQYAEPNWVCYPARVPNDPRYPGQWHHPVIQTPRAWDLWTGRSNFITAYVDTGIQRTHPDLAPNRISGYNSYDDKTEVAGGDVEDMNGHGTHVSGCGSAIGNNGLGVAGAGWNFKILFVKCVGSANGSAGSTTLDAILRGCRWAADNGAKTVSASWSGVDAAPVGQTGTYIKGKNALFFYAAGNDNRDLGALNYRDTIVVGASNQADTKASFSAYGRGIGVFAPGQDILSTVVGSGYAENSGTSMATPLASGVTALIWSVNPALTAQQVQNILYTTTDNIGPVATFGNGRVNAFKGVKAAFATLGRDIAPNGVSTYVGNFVGGGLAQIITPGLTKSYDVASVSSSPAGHVAGVAVDFRSDVDRSQVTSLSAVFDASTSVNQPTTAMFYFWNYNTNAYDLVAANPVVAGGSLGIRVNTTNPQNYVSGNRSIRVLVRSNVQLRRGSPYILKVHFAKLILASLPD